MAFAAAAAVILMGKPRQTLWNVSNSVSENVSLELPMLTRAYFRAGRAIFRIVPAPRALHRFRLDTKRFRYTLELFAPCYGPGLEKRLSRLRKIQDFLGEINDCVATRDLIGRRSARASSFLARRTAAKAGAARKFWEQVFDADGQERWWADYLARFARK
jgi:CHAD domain-containing protein